MDFRILRVIGSWGGGCCRCGDRDARTRRGAVHLRGRFVAVRAQIGRDGRLVGGELALDGTRHRTLQQQKIRPQFNKSSVLNGH